MLSKQKVKNLSMQIWKSVGDEVFISSNQDIIVYLPFSDDGKIIYEANGERTEVKAKKTENDLWMVDMPAVMNAIIYK